MVDDDPEHLEAIATALRSDGLFVRTCDSVASVRTLLERIKIALRNDATSPEASGDRLMIDLLILDVMLPDGTAFDVLGEFDRWRYERRTVPLFPTPLTIAISGEASRIDTFMLPIRGVFEYMEKPLSIREFVPGVRRAIEREAQELPPMAELTARFAGQSERYQEILALVQRRLIDEAIARTRSISGAAELIGLTRPALQQILARTRGEEGRREVRQQLGWLRRLFGRHRSTPSVGTS